MNDNQLHRAALALSDGAHGHFAAHIGDAYLSADPANRERLTAAFGDLFARAHQFNNRLEIISHE